KKVAACVFMPTFNNPLGSTMSESNKQKLVQLLAELEIPLIEDDVYGPLAYQGKRPRAAKAFDVNDNVIYCSSFSKIVAPGLRIGWVVAGLYAESIQYHKFLDNISTAAIPQLTMVEMLAKGNLRRTSLNAARIYQHRMELMRRSISQNFPASTRISNPQGGFLLWVELPESIDSVELYERAMEKKIAITPGLLFSAQGQYRHHVRLSCGAVDVETMKKSIEVLARLCHAMLEGTSD
ncbi:MAG: PLP-dependent aminotransferase family protein, partial [Gammaproteobacteria bacterium]|nr:PLP-dependent aminotransferase family protein [Gammaproteobacteria bacterium]